MTQRGRLKLLHGGFDFIKHSNNKQGISYWVCSKRRPSYCKGRAQTRRVGTKEIVEVYGTHNHPPENITTEKKVPISK